MELTKKNLRNWLESKVTDSCVGYRGSPDACPIAQFIKENKNNIKEVVVFPDTLRYNRVYGGNVSYKRLPKWASSFIRSIDYNLSRGLPSGVMAEEALSVLEEV